LHNTPHLFVFVIQSTPEADRTNAECDYLNRFNIHASR
jgi:hypothetical protein